MGEAENDRERINMGVAEMVVKQKTTVRGRMWIWRRWG